jgi:hypothetical protein
MKTNFKVIASIFALGFVILTILHIFLQYGLTKAMRDVVLPRIRQETGVDVRVGHLSINVAAGRLILKNVSIRNPEGFVLENLASAGRIEVVVDIPSLFRQKPLRVKKAEVRNAVVNAVRNRAGELNINVLQERLPPRPEQPMPADQPRIDPGSRLPPTRQPAPKTAEQEPVEPKPLPEVLVETMRCSAQLRYLDMRYEAVDLALDLTVDGQGLSTRRDLEAPWGMVVLNGSLGNDRTRFVTDLDLRLAPVTDLQTPSFDLTGRVMEIDPRIMQEAYSRLGIRSAPFGFDPDLHCREGVFERSRVALALKDIELEDKLSRRLGGMGTIASLRFVVPVEGTLQSPVIDLQGALRSAIGGNTQSLLEALLKGVVPEADLNEPSGSASDAAVELLGEYVEEIGESETAKKVLKDWVDGKPPPTNAAPASTSDVLVDILGEEIEEIGESELLKEGLKDLGRTLFGD